MAIERIPRPILGLLALATVALPPSALPAPAASAGVESAGPPAAQATNVRIGIVGTSPSDGPLFIAQERGYFREQGLTTELVNFQSGGEMIAPLAASQLEIATGAISAGLFNAISRGVAMRIVADKQHSPPDSIAQGWLLRRELLDGGQVRGPADLRGRVVGIAATGSILDRELAELLRRVGLTTRDVDIRTLNYTDQAAAFANRSVDLACSFVPLISAMERNGDAVLWFRAGELVPNHQATVIIYSQALAEQQPDVGRRWMVAHLKAVRDYVRAFSGPTRDESVLAIMAQYSGRDLQFWRELPPPALHPDGLLNEQSIRDDLDFMVEAGLVTQRPDLARVIDTSFVEYALQQLGRFER